MPVETGIQRNEVSPALTGVQISYMSQNFFVLLEIHLHWHKTASSDNTEPQANRNSDSISASQVHDALAAILRGRR